MTSGFENELDMAERRRHVDDAVVSGEMIFAVCVLAAIFLAGCSPGSSNEFQGYIEGEYVYVASPLGGTLQNLAVARGDEVKSGQWLFELERRSEADAARQASNNLAQAKANLALSETDFARREQLRNDQGVISAEELDQARAQRDADQAQVAAKSAALAKANWSFEQKEQFAPASAFVQDTLYRVGEWVAAGKPVVQLLPPANLKVRFFVPEVALPKIKPGQTVRVTFDCGTARTRRRELHFDASRIHAPGDLQPGARETVFIIEAKFSPAGRPRPSPWPAGGCGAPNETSNLQPPTSNPQSVPERPESAVRCWMLGVGCFLFL